MKVGTQASITFAITKEKRRYRWKSEDKVSEYLTSERRIILRVHSASFGNKVIKLDRSKRQVDVNFVFNKNMWIADIRRVATKNLTLYSYVSKGSQQHSSLVVVINKIIPHELLDDLKSMLKGKQCVSIPIVCRINIEDWKDIDLQPWDFLYHTEIHAKELMKDALNKGFDVSFVPRGRDYDLELISPNQTKFAIAILSHTAKTESRSKQHRINKALLDIAKMLPLLHKDDLLAPVIISQPFNFNGSWSFTTENYINFYRERYGFLFIFTNFEKGWTEFVIKKLKDFTGDKPKTI